MRERNPLPEIRYYQQPKQRPRKERKMTFVGLPVFVIVSVSAAEREREGGRGRELKL